jgi:hypothetical protein
LDLLLEGKIVDWREWTGPRTNCRVPVGGNAVGCIAIYAGEEAFDHHRSPPTQKVVKIEGE